MLKSIPEIMSPVSKYYKIDQCHKIEKTIKKVVIIITKSLRETVINCPQY